MGRVRRSPWRETQKVRSGNHGHTGKGEDCGAPGEETEGETEK